MENNDVVMTEEEIKQDLIDQVSESAESDSYEPEEISEDGNGSKAGVIGLAIGLGAAVVTGGVILYNKVKSGAVNQRIEVAKEHRELKKQEREAIKEIKTRSRNDIKAIRHPAKEEPTETSKEPAAEVETKKTSKK